MKAGSLRQLRRNLALLLCAAMMLSPVGMTSAEEMPGQPDNSEIQCVSGGDQESGLPGGSTVSDGDQESGSPGGGTVSDGDDEDAVSVTLRVLDLAGGQGKINDDTREMPEVYLPDASVKLLDGRVLPGNLQECAPQVAGWKFVAWYTAPVKYAFWGDKTGTGWEPEPLPFSYDCDGNEYHYQVDKTQYPEASHSMTGYWYWLSTLKETGRKVQAGDVLAESETTLYALYAPVLIHYTLDYSGWNGRNGVLSCGRQYGTPFGSDDVDQAGWPGYVFDGWYPEGGDSRMSFYSIPQDGVRYVAHWHSEDGRVTWENYRQLGYRDVTSVTMKDGSVGSGERDLGDTLHLYVCSGVSRTILAAVSPADSGVTKLTWEVTGDTGAVRLEVKDDGLRAVVSATGVEGRAIVTVKSANGCSDSVTVDTTGHAFDKSEVIKWGNCATDTEIRETCVYCGKVQIRRTRSNHQYAYRDVPATCTEPHKWVSYCKICGELNPEKDMIREPAAGHDFKILEAVGCGGATITKICQTCGYTEVSSDPSIASHNWASVYTVDKRPTCKDEGSQSIRCLNCGAVKPDSSELIPPDPSLHVWEAWTVTEEATETTPGEQHRTCSVCGMEETRAIPPTSYQVDPSDITGSMGMDGSDQLTDQAQANAAIRRTINRLLVNGSMLGDDVRFAAIQQQKISAQVCVTSVAAPESAFDADGFNALLGADASVFYMDIDIFVKAGDQNIGRITETDASMTFSSQIPAGGRIIQVLRAHNGVIETIPCWVEGGTVYFSTDKFSTFAISSSNDISLAVSDVIADQAYTGEQIRPTVKLTINGGQTLTEGVDYTLSYSNNVQPGTATVTVTGMGAFAGSSRQLCFQIVNQGGAGYAGGKPAADPVWNSKVDVDWSEVESNVRNAAKGSDVTVSVGTELVIPASVQNRMFQKKVGAICYVKGTDITFTLSAGDVKKTKKDLTLGISNRADIPDAVAAEVKDSALFSRALTVSAQTLPQRLNMHMVLGEKYAGKYAALYSYDEKSGSMLLEGSFQITENGRAVFPLLRGGRYLVVVTEERKAAGYQVAPGDTLSRIAARNGVSLKTLIRANPQIKNINRIYAGEKIMIPAR